MYPILILREELVCFIILLYLIFITRVYRMGKDSRIFNRMLAYATFHVIMDGVTIWTVNHRDLIPRWLNDGCICSFTRPPFCTPMNS